jgi:hypothetical protein
MYKLVLIDATSSARDVAEKEKDKIKDIALLKTK